MLEGHLEVVDGEDGVGVEVGLEVLEVVEAAGVWKWELKWVRTSFLLFESLALSGAMGTVGLLLPRWNAGSPGPSGAPGR